VTRAKVSEGLQLAAPAKIAVAEAFMTRGTWPASNSEAAMEDAADIKGSYVSKVKVSGNANATSTITITYANDSRIDGHTIELVPTFNGGSTVWDCTQGDLEKRYRPASCR